jgi:hypothetical protein
MHRVAGLLIAGCAMMLLYVVIRYPVLMVGGLPFAWLLWKGRRG